MTPDIRLQRWFDAPPDVVFDAYEDLDPEGIGLRRTSSIETPGATHLRFEVVK